MDYDTLRYVPMLAPIMAQSELINIFVFRA